MNKIKIVGGLVFILMMVLALLTNHIATKNRVNSHALNLINQKRSSAQEITKMILYGYKNRDKSSDKLEKSIKKFLANQNSENSSQLWNRFYTEIEKFQEQQKVTMLYGSLITQKTVNNIYSINMELILKFNKTLETNQHHYHEKIDVYKTIQYMLFFILILLLIYLFTQVRQIITFIQKFSKTSKSIIENSTIQGLEPMEIQEHDVKLKEATKNYNHMVENINHSIEQATLSMGHSTQALEELEGNIEEFIGLLFAMKNSESDELFKREDAVIDSLETLMNLKETLMNLKRDLDNLKS